LRHSQKEVDKNGGRVPAVLEIEKRSLPSADGEQLATKICVENKKSSDDTGTIDSITGCM
jgi:hypothetical protein